MNSKNILNAANVSAATITVAGADLTASVTAAAASATASAASAAASASSAGTAATEAALAAASADFLDDRQLGAKASDPTLDNDGNALLTGAQYFNTTLNRMKVFNGTTFQLTTASAADVVNVPAGSIAAVDVQAALNELDTEKSSTAHVHAASAITNVAAGGIAATDVQAAIDELDSEKATLLLTVDQDSDTGAANLPTGTTAQRPGTPVEGMFRRNSQTSQFEGYTGADWAGVGGASGGAGNPVFYENNTNVTVDFTITTGNNAMSAGPITIDSGITVTVPSGSEWTIV